MKKDFMNKITRAFSTVGLKLKKNSPEILIAAGVIGTVTAAVTACFATTKIDTILEDTKKKVDIIHEGAEKGEAVSVVDGKREIVPYSKEDAGKDLTIVYAKTVLQFAKLYAPSIILGGLSIAAIISGDSIHRKRNIALASAYTGIYKSFKDYRGRVVNRFGEGLDKELLYDIRTDEVEETTVDENGNEIVTKTAVTKPHIDNHNEYTRCYAEGNNGWDKDPNLSLMFLRRAQDYFTDRLKKRRYVYLNEVYEYLGYQTTAAGQVVGWIYDEDNAVGDNYVDFGIWDQDDERKVAFVNGDERNIWLDFNVDGYILDRI